MYNALIQMSIEHHGSGVEMSSDDGEGLTIDNNISPKPAEKSWRNYITNVNPNIREKSDDKLAIAQKVFRLRYEANYLYEDEKKEKLRDLGDYMDEQFGEEGDNLPSYVNDIMAHLMPKRRQFR